jgi:hypothetical protein
MRESIEQLAAKLYAQARGSDAGEPTESVLVRMADVIQKTIEEAK